MADNIDMLIGWGKYLLLLCGVIGLGFCAGQMILGRRNRSSMAADGATGIPWVLGGLSLIAVTPAVVTRFFFSG